MAGKSWTGAGAPGIVLCCVVTVLGGTGVWARATYGARTSADEPQYLLSAQSLVQDHDLDIADELTARRWKTYHQAPLPRQTRVLDDGRQISPHDPLLPVLLAPGFAVAGWIGAKLSLAALAGALALTIWWLAVRRFAARPVAAALAVGALCLSPPLVAYATQVYPEMPAALATTIGLAGATSGLDRAGLAVVTLSIAALAGLGSKYVLVGGALALVALVGLVRARRHRAAIGLTAALGLVGVATVGLHLAIYGGLTPYAVGSHFGAGELTVAGTEPDLLGRANRLTALVVDRDFGLLVWGPAWGVLPAALGWFARRSTQRAAVVVVGAAGWLTATFVALTMQGWWWPGRQVVVVLGVLAVPVALWAAAVDAPRWRLRALVGLGVVGLAGWLRLVAETVAGTRALIVDFAQTANPVVQAIRLVLPDTARFSSTDRLALAAWSVAGFTVAAASWRAAVPKETP